MSEERLQLPVGEGVTLYGTYLAADGAPLVVLVHGLTGHSNEAMHYLARRRLHAEGYAVLGLDLYGSDPGTRRLTDCTTSTHARDLVAVLDAMRTRCPKVQVVVVGHSLGGLTGLMATGYDALVLWDAAHTSGLLSLQNLEYVEELQLHRWRQRIDHLLNPAMIEQLRTLDSDALVGQVRVPLLVVSAGDPGRPELSRRYVEHAGGPAELRVVEDADHGFLRGESLTTLLDLTCDWLRRTVPVS